VESGVFPKPGLWPPAQAPKQKGLLKKGVEADE